MYISIIIPNYNGAGLLKKNILHVFQAMRYYVEKTKKSVEVIIVDDASEDDSISVLDTLTKSETSIKSTIITSETNVGFSSAVNKGVKHAQGEIVVLLNTDVSPSKDFLIPLTKHFVDENVFAVGAMDKSIEEGNEVLRGRGVGTWQKGFLIHKAGKLDKNTSLWAGGGSSAFKKILWDKLDGLDYLFNPFYWEDIDISYRALKSGYTVLFEKESVVIHEHEKGAIKTKYTSGEVKKIAYRNQFFFVWKNADISHIFTHIIWLPYHFIKAIGRGDTHFFEGFFTAFKNIFSVIKKRKKAQKNFIYSDYDIITRYQQ